jgi:hypothetical protein
VSCNRVHGRQIYPFHRYSNQQKPARTTHNEDRKQYNNANTWIKYLSLSLFPTIHRSHTTRCQSRIYQQQLHKKPIEKLNKDMLPQLMRFSTIKLKTYRKFTTSVKLIKAIITYLLHPAALLKCAKNLKSNMQKSKISPRQQYNK